MLEIVIFALRWHPRQWVLLFLILSVLSRRTLMFTSTCGGMGVRIGIQSLESGRRKRMPPGSLSLDVRILNKSPLLVI
jgi:hypothetical protein